jgi:hypothetical protein
MMARPKQAIKTGTIDSFVSDSFASDSFVSDSFVSDSFVSDSFLRVWVCFFFDMREESEKARE